MNPVLAYKIARTTWERFDDYRSKKAEEAYSALEELAHSPVVDEARSRAGAVTQAAHNRLDQRLADLGIGAPAKRRKRRKTVSVVAAVLALLAAFAGGAYYWLRKNDIPAAQPPRVEDFETEQAEESEDSVLVYSTSTEEKRG